MKSTITKATKDGAVLWKAILELTPSQSSSQIQRAPLNSVLCAFSAQVARILVKSYHDTEAKPLPRLVIQQAHSNWKPGNIVDSVALRSYIV